MPQVGRWVSRECTRSPMRDGMHVVEYKFESVGLILMQVRISVARFIALIVLSNSGARRDKAGSPADVKHTGRPILDVCWRA